MNIAEEIEKSIVSEHYFLVSDAIRNEKTVHVAPEKGWLLGNTQLMTICVLQLDNGFVVTGHSACLDPAKFNEVLGRAIARDNAVDSVSKLIAFRVKDSQMANAQEKTNE